MTQTMKKEYETNSPENSGVSTGIYQDYQQVLLSVWKSIASYYKQFVTNRKGSEYRNGLFKNTNWEESVSPTMCVMLTHVPQCLLNEVERGKFTAPAPGISWEQTEHANTIHLVLAVDKEKALRPAVWSHQAKARGYHNVFNKQVHFNSQWVSFQITPLKSLLNCSEHEFPHQQTEMMRLPPGVYGRIRKSKKHGAFCLTAVISCFMLWGPLWCGALRLHFNGGRREGLAALEQGFPFLALLILG